MATSSEPALQQRIEAVIREFPFDNFGMDNVSFALEDDPEAQEWVPALARKILAALDGEATG
ncbi:hypothetical protein [Streptomyces stelliscabiei]|uniref:hypothetical protein n=1 Tax=Streptomyces stelliscabiei TaxID=146820 RepID=UPI002FF395C8